MKPWLQKEEACIPVVEQRHSLSEGGVRKSKRHLLHCFSMCREAPTMLGKSASKAAGKLSRKTEKKETKQRIKLNPELRVRKKKKIVKKGGKNNKGKGK